MGARPSFGRAQIGYGRGEATCLRWCPACGSADLNLSAPSRSRFVQQGPTRPVSGPGLYATRLRLVLRYVVGFIWSALGPRKGAIGFMWVVNLVNFQLTLGHCCCQMHIELIIAYVCHRPASRSSAHRPAGRLPAQRPQHVPARDGGAVMQAHLNSSLDLLDAMPALRGKSRQWPAVTPENRSLRLYPD